MELVNSVHSLNIDEVPTNIENFSAIIKGHHTEFVISAFENLFTYVITQYGKLGNLYSIETERVENGLCTPDTIFNVRTLLGGDNIDIEVGVRFIYEKLRLGKPALISLTLKDYSVDSLKAIIKAIENYKPESA